MRFYTGKDGDHRYIKKFLWFPIKISGTWVWLEIVYIRQGYYETFPFRGWSNICLTDPETEARLGIQEKK